MLEHVEFVYTAGMDEEELDEWLREGETGVLALADGGRAYAVPVSYYYDGEALFFRLGDDAHSKKLDFVETTAEACFLRYGLDGEDSWSVIATGQLRRDDDALDAETINERFTSLRVFDEAIDDLELVMFRLDIETLTGRRTTG
jgi:hypothetical protein